MPRTFRLSLLRIEVRLREVTQQMAFLDCTAIGSNSSHAGRTIIERCYTWRCTEDEARVAMERERE